MKLKIFIYAIATMAVSYSVNAQNATLFGGSVRLSFTEYTAAHGNIDGVSNLQYHTQRDMAKLHHGGVTLDADLLRLGKGFSAGVHLGMLQTVYQDYYVAGVEGAEHKRMMGFHYGIDLTCHLLQLAGSDNRHWDATVGLLLGSYASRYVSPRAEYALNASLGYYPFEHFGIVFEYAWGIFTFPYMESPVLTTSRVQAKLGLAYRF